MKDYFNPFEYEAATKFNAGQILNFYIEDFNYSRFISSRRNIFLVGERGSGKSMTLLYNSLPVQLKKAAKENREFGFDIICVYIPCKTPLIYRREDQLLEDFQAAVVSEHFLVLTTMYAIAETLSVVPGLVEDELAAQLRQEIEFTFDFQLPEGTPFFDALKQALQKEAIMGLDSGWARQ